ncbi:hypothetical protein ABK040_009788 [Willaertia magna]
MISGNNSDYFDSSPSSNNVDLNNNNNIDYFSQIRPVRFDISTFMGSVPESEMGTGFYTQTIPTETPNKIDKQENDTRYQISDQGVEKIFYLINKETQEWKEIPLQKKEFFFNDLVKIGFLGKGHFGSVTLMKNKLNGKYYAMKKIPLRDVKSAWREFHAMYSSDSNYIVKVYDCFIRDQQFNLILEYMDEGTVLELIEKLNILKFFTALLNNQLMDVKHYSWMNDKELFVNVNRAINQYYHENITEKSYVTFLLDEKGIPSDPINIKKNIVFEKTKINLNLLEIRFKNGHLLSEIECGIIVYSILKGLHYTRKKHCIHRDTKPSNVLLNSKGEVKISDFGLARVKDETVINVGNEETLYQTICGSSRYQSPERVEEQTYSYNCDLWSLIILAIELFTGKPSIYIHPYPWDKVSFNETSSQHFVQDHLQCLKEYGASEEFLSFCKKCLIVDRNKRPGLDSNLFKLPFLKKIDSIEKEKRDEIIENLLLLISECFPKEKTNFN